MELRGAKAAIWQWRTWTRILSVDYRLFTDETKCGFSGGPVGRIKAEALTSDVLMRLLANASGRVVVDRTGLEGPFAVDLEWSHDQSVSDKPSIFTAVGSPVK